MNVSLTPELEALIAAKVSSGFYHSSSEVVREALRLLAEHDTIKQKRIEALNHDIQAGIDQADAGLLVDANEAYRRIMQEHEQETHG